MSKSVIAVIDSNRKSQRIGRQRCSAGKLPKLNKEKLWIMTFQSASKNNHLNINIKQILSIEIVLIVMQKSKKLENAYRLMQLI
tara:strand:- start:51 stop:302 length:252 start_codon:yes stop_codon:yes gene_type:complete